MTMATCPVCHGAMLTERPHFHGVDVMMTTTPSPLAEPASMPVELVRSCERDLDTELRGANAEIDWLRELLRQVTLDYGFNCTDPEDCDYSMGRAIRTVAEWNPTDRPR